MLRLVGLTGRAALRGILGTSNMSLFATFSADIKVCLMFQDELWGYSMTSKPLNLSVSCQCDQIYMC